MSKDIWKTLFTHLLVLIYNCIESESDMNKMRISSTDAESRKMLDRGQNFSDVASTFTLSMPLFCRQHNDVHSLKMTLGRYETLSLSWRAGGTPVITEVKVYTDSLIVAFTQSFPQGA